MKKLPVELIQLEQILSPVAKNNYKSIAITASLPQEGCSTLCLGLAKRTAVGDKSTLIVDMNLSNPAISNHFKANLKDYSSLQETIEQNVQSTPIPNLFVLPAPVRSKYLLDLREREKFSQCLNTWMDKFRYVFIDCSSVIHTDNQIIPAENICSVIQGCVLIVLAGRTTEAKVVEAVNKLKSVDANIVGTVLNDQFNQRLDDELCTATHKFDKYFPNLMEKIRHKIKNSAILTLNV